MAADDQDSGDGQARAALARLTRNERECLRRRLLPQTAKEMAIDLGVSPHAVEKRLKMARAKLGVTSSLHAARLLAAAEGYGAMVPHAPDLPDAAPVPQGMAAASTPRRWRVPPAILVTGALSMILVTALLAILPQAAGPAPSASAPPRLPDRIVSLPADSSGPRIGTEPAPERVEDVKMRAAGPAEVEAFVRSSFRTMDIDGSGYVEQAEAPVAGVGIDERPAEGKRVRGAKVNWFVGPRGQAMWIANMDTDRDGRASEAEYVAWDTRLWRDHVPDNWAWRR